MNQSLKKYFARSITHLYDPINRLLKRMLNCIGCIYTLHFHASHDGYSDDIDFYIWLGNRDTEPFHQSVHQRAVVV